MLKLPLGIIGGFRDDFSIRWMKGQPALKFSIDFHGRYPVDEYVRIANQAEDH